MTELFFGKVINLPMLNNDCTLQGRHENIDWSEKLMEDKTITQLCASIILKSYCQ